MCDYSTLAVPEQPTNVQWPLVLAWCGDNSGNNRVYHIQAQGSLLHVWGLPTHNTKIWLRVSLQINLDLPAYGSDL